MNISMDIVCDVDPNYICIFNHLTASECDI